jgi:hypothetical protein
MLDFFVALVLTPTLISPRRPQESGGMYHEGKQAQIGLRLTDSGPENPRNTIGF